jgi:D-amino-acid dehydrogenase
MSSKRSVIIGGGVIGAFVAWYLRRCGHEVTIVEANRFGSGCSHANCGYVCPSHVLPLAVPGAVAKTLRAMLSPNSPFLIRPRMSWALWHWLLNFALRCNRADMLRSAESIHQLLQSSLLLYEELLQHENLSIQWERRGLLFVFRDRHHFEAHRSTDALLSKKFGVSAVPYAGEAVRELEPALKEGLAGGWHYPQDCHLRPDLLMQELFQLLKRNGVTILENAAMTGFASKGRRAEAVLTKAGDVSGDHFVVATGAWTPLLSKALGVRVPIQPGKGYSITTTVPSVAPKIPLIFEEHSVAITPFQDGFRIGSTMEFAGYDDRLNPRRLQLLRRAAGIYLTLPHSDQTQEEWYGWRPMTWDSKPVVDRSPTLENVWIAAGHGMLGVSMAPATGKLVAELIEAVEPHIDPKPLNLRRFG